MNATLNSILADLDSIGLDELNKRAAMLTRVDRKYALDAATASAILSRLPEDVKVLQIDSQVSQGYASTYYDTPRCARTALRSPAPTWSSSKRSRVRPHPWWTTSCGRAACDP